MAIMRAVILTLILALMPFASLNFVQEEPEFLAPSNEGFESSSTLTTLGWEWAVQVGPTFDFEADAVTVSNSGDVYVAGKTIELNTANNLAYAGSDFSVGQCNIPDYSVFFVVKLDSSGQCLSAANVTYNMGGLSRYTHDGYIGGISLDAQDNLYVAGSIDFTRDDITNAYLNFGSTFTVDACPSPNRCTLGFVAKLNNTGEWEWVKKGETPSSANDVRFNSIDTDANGTSIIGGYSNAPFCLDTVCVGNSGDTSGIQHYNDDILVAKIDTNGTWQWAEIVRGPYGPGGHDSVNDVILAPDGSAYVTGYVRYVSHNSSITFGQHPLAGYDHLQVAEEFTSAFVAKINSTGVWQWARGWDQDTSLTKGNSIALDSNNNIYIGGLMYGSVTANTSTVSSGGTQNPFIAKIDGNGTSWDWVKLIQCLCTSEISSIDTDIYDNVLVTGSYSAYTTFANLQLPPSAGLVDFFVAKINPNSNWIFAIGAGSATYDISNEITTDNFGNAYVVGGVGGSANYGNILIQNLGDSDWFLTKLTADYDGDLKPDTIDDDDDNDYIIDIQDQCDYSPLGFQSISAIDHDGDGCRDSDEDDDDDNDNVLDSVDDCPHGMTGWTTSNATDMDRDGCMDALEDFDDDNDGFEDYEDLCPRDAGNSTGRLGFEFEKGCPDSDGDGRPDIRDPFVNNASEWSDLDGDKVGDNSDAFKTDSTQTKDTDGDTYGDNSRGFEGDACPSILGYSYMDRFGCVDSDSDGWSDEGDDFEFNNAYYLDTDNDTVPDELDSFPFDPTQKQDTDGDGYGDNADGNLGDAFPDDPTRHADTDRDSYDDDNDAFPFDPTQWLDSDGDNYGDNPLGLRADAFRMEPSQWSDADGDGWGDNSTGTRADAFPTDITQWSDMDGDGYGDNQFGINPDAYPKDATQWADLDGDGLGDNPDGNNPDPFVNDTDNDGYNNSIDPLPTLATPGDMDGDMCLDEEDLFPRNPLECKDSDGDGWGDNQDSDDDNDGVNDITELQSGTNPMDAASKPVELFEIAVPGTKIGLGAWDLIGIFGGVPFFTWILFCLITRRGRTKKYEKALFESKTEGELASVSKRYEFSLMLRLIGSHHALRLERIRSNLEAHFNEIERKISEDPDFEYSMGIGDEESSAPSIDIVGMVHTDGYEWTDHGGCKWYRVANSGSEWNRWQ